MTVDRIPRCDNFPNDFFISAVSTSNAALLSYDAEEDSKLREISPRATCHRERRASGRGQPQRASVGGVCEAGDQDPEASGDPSENGASCE